MVGKAQKLHGARPELNSVVGLEKVDRLNPMRTSTIQSRSHPMRFLGFSNCGSFEVINSLQYIFEKWVECCKKYIAFQGRYFKKKTVTTPPQSSDSE
jgi:hypothetical protein